MGVCPNTSLQHNTRDEVQTANVDGSISSPLLDNAGSIKSKLSFQVFRILDELSRVAASTSTGLQPQQISAASEVSYHSPDSQPKRQSAEMEALYIFSPGHESTAFYMYRPKDSASKDMYESAHVPVKVIRDLGRLAYLITVSDQDDMVDTLNFSSTSGETRSEPRSTTQTPKADGSSHNSTDQSSQGLRSADLYEQCHDHSSVNSGPSEIRIIMDGVKDRLISRDRCQSSIDDDNGSGKHEVAGRGSYLVTNDEIIAAVNAAAADVDQTNTDRSPLRSSSRISSSSSNSLSLPKLDSQMNSITPHQSAAADPATTFSVPRASFSSLGRADNWFHLNKGLDVSTRATVVSRRSVTDFVWTENQHHGGESGPQRVVETVSGVVSDGSSLENGPLAIQPSANTRLHQTETDIKERSLLQSSVPETLEDFVERFSHPGTSSQSTDTASNITSFPGLLPRRSTQEWLNPPVDMEQLTRPSSADLYVLGVDAHSGGIPHQPGSCLEQRLNEAQCCNHSLFQDDPFCNANIHPFERRATEGSASLSAEKRLGAAIGSSSHRRRSCQVLGSKARQLDCKGGLLPSVLDRFRKRGDSIFHLRGCLEDSAFPQAGTPTNSLADDCLSRAEPQSRDCLFRERTLQPPSSDISGICEAMTGGTMTIPRKGPDTCSEDYRPHVYENDMDSSMGAASP